MRAIDPATIIERWQRVSPRIDDTLRETRALAHWGVQPVGAAGEVLCAHRADFAHTSLEWDCANHRFIGNCDEGIRVALAAESMELMLLDEAGVTMESRVLSGTTLAAAFAWLNDSLARRDLLSGAKVQMPGHEMPSHPYGDGAPFSIGNAGAREELARWYDNAALCTGAVSEQTDGTSPVRVWPHHFDIATLITIDADEPDPEKARSIGFGLSPGDQYYDEPYFYVNPWPFPAPEGLPDLDGEGAWHSTDWVGAVLPAHRIVDSNARDQASQVTAYIASALPAARDLLGT